MTQWFLLKTTVYFSVCTPGLLTRSPFIATKQNSECVCVCVSERERRSEEGESMSRNCLPTLDRSKCSIYVLLWITWIWSPAVLSVPHCVCLHSKKKFEACLASLKVWSHVGHTIIATHCICKCHHIEFVVNYTTTFHCNMFQVCTAKFLYVLYSVIKAISYLVF